MSDEIFRETLSGPIDPEHIRKMHEDGWKPRAIEWEREVPEPGKARANTPEVPFGLRIAADCARLEENPAEMRILFVMMEMVVQDASLTDMAGELNRRGYKTRNGSDWTPLTVYNVFPRLVEVSPRIFSDQAWTSREASRVRWNS
jgi:Recombinase